MLRALAFGLAVGAGVQAWRQWPPDGPTAASSGIVVMVAGIVMAYLAGRWHGRGNGGASATATAIATANAASVGNTVQVYVAAPGGGVQPVTSVVGVASVPSADAPWMTSEAVAELDVSTLEGMDLAELLEDYESSG